MATAEKTVIFSFPMTTTLVADATVTNLTQISLYIPESSPTFTSVFVDVGFQDVITATGGTIGEHRVGLQLASAGYSTITETDDITNSGENMAGIIGPFDFTSYFNTNWTGTSMTCDLQVYFDQTTGTTLGMNNVTALVYVTYTYDDAAATQVKTVRVPMDSNTTTLPSSATNYGTNQIPALTSGGLLPEDSIVIRDWFIVIEGNENGVNATDFTISVNIDGGATTSFMTQERALASDRFCRWIYKPSVPDTTSAHNLQMWASLTGKFNHQSVILYVTYEFAESTTSTVLNSLLLPIEMASPLGRNTSSFASRFTREIIISEPGTITLKQSAFRINYNVPSSPATHVWKAGSQAYRTYTAAATTPVGMYSMQQRIDSGGAQGAGMTLARGSNTITIDGYCGSASVELTTINGYIILNYTSDKASGGLSTHAVTVFKTLLVWNALLSDLNLISSYSFAIQPTNYWIMGAGFCFYQWVLSASMAVTFDVECRSTEGKGAGYYDIYADAYATASERACSVIWMRGHDVYKRFPDDMGADRIDIETARNYRLYTTTTSSSGMIASMTYHSHTWAVAGSISGNDAGLTTQLRLVRDDTKEVLQEQTLSAGTTSYSFTVYDDTIDYYVDAYQDGTHLGRSAIGNAA